jgi:hypothetical protein
MCERRQHAPAIPAHTPANQELAEPARLVDGDRQTAVAKQMRQRLLPHQQQEQE